MELLLLADASRRAGAARLTPVVPYFGYARQDRRAGGREAVGARLVADLIRASGFERVIAVDVHSPALEGFFSSPLERLSAVPLLVEAVRRSVSDQDVVVAPDLGAAKLAERIGRLLHLPSAIVHKVRVSGEEVRTTGISGDVRGRAPLIVDDMVSTGGTIEAAARALLAAGCLPDLRVVMSHALLVGSAAERLRALPIRECFATDSVAGMSGHLLPMQTVSLAPLLADAIDRLHHNRSLSDIITYA
jgi:ribose-phosphate pyrophosphokinase